MKKTFTLDLSQSSVRLLMGSGRDARLVGEVALGDPQFETRLEDLRREGEAWAEGPLATEVLIPHSEILFTTIETEAEAKKDREQEVRQALEGLTPYSIADLVYHWTDKAKAGLGVAAVARETLVEAEDFAVAHGFNPMSFAAGPKKGLFRGRVPLGPTAFSAEAERVAGRDEPPVTRMVDLLREETGPPPPVAEPEESPSEPGPATPEPPAHAETPDVQPRSAGADPAPSPEDADAPPDPKDAVPGETAMTFGSGRGAEMPASPAGFASRRAAFRTESDPDAPPPGPAPGVGPSSRLSTVSSRIAIVPDGGAGARPALTSVETSTTDDADTPTDTGETAPNGGSSTDPPPLFGRGRTAPKAATPGPGAGQGPVRASRGRAPKAPIPVVRRVAPPDEIPGAASRTLSATAGSDWSGAPDAERDAALRPGAAAPRPIVSEATVLTTFGDRNPPERRAGTPILPVVFGVLVALGLAIIVWTAFFLFAPREALAPLGDGEEIAALPDAAEPPAATQDAQAAPDPTAPPEAAPDDPAGASTGEAGGGTEPSTDDPLRRAAGAADSGRYAATGVDVEPPALPQGLARAADGDVTIAAADPDLSATERPPVLAVPEAAAPGPDAAAVAPEQEAPSGANPEPPEPVPAIEVTRGAPPVEPPAAPNRAETAPEAEAPRIAIPVNSGEPALRPRARPDDAAQGDRSALPDTTGSPRPGGNTAQPEPAAAAGDLQTETDSGQAAEAGSAPLPESDTAPAPEILAGVARLSPRPRPTGANISGDAAVAEAAAEAVAAEVADSAAARASDAAAAGSAAATALASLVPEVQADAVPRPTSPYAVARSIKPADRPGNFARNVERARTAIATAPQPVATAAAVVTPRAPTSGSVAQRATIPNVLNLRRVNLIGVYGSQSNRRALVRLPGGKFVKVKVGDRMDGGQVRAIGANDLSYVKGGRSVVLQMPRS